MRVMIMFDLPVTSAAERREYAHFRKLLIKNGFIMMQESIYTKLVQNESAARWAVDTVRKNKPKDGLVQALVVTEKQFAKIEYILGNASSEVLTSDERIVPPAENRYAEYACGRERRFLGKSCQ